MRTRVPLALVLGWVVLLLALLVPKVGHAQTISWDNVNPIRQVKLRPNQPYLISRTDCEANDAFTFNITVTGATTNFLEVWASNNGTNCADYNSRQAVSQVTNCYPVFYTIPVIGTQQVSIRVQDIVAVRRVLESVSVGHGNAADCAQDNGTGAAVGVTLYFLLIDSVGQNAFAGSAPTYSTKYDLLGPPPPAGVSAGTGENRLFVNWIPTQNSDVFGFTLYCTPGTVIAATSDAGTTGAAGAGGATTTSGGQPSGGTAGEGGGVGVGGALFGVGGAGTGIGGSGGTVASTNCISSLLVPGEIPLSTWPVCGTTSAALTSQAVAKGLANDTTYAVGVAAFDQVNNVGKLSELACGTPELVNDFFDLYRQAGGKAGGGFCSITRQRSPWTVLMLLGACLGYALRRRRP